MQINTALRYICLGGVFLVPFIVFIVTSSMFFPFITGKNFAFRIITEIIFTSWIVLVLRDAAYRPKFSWLLASVAAFVGIVALADFFGESPFKSFWSNFERMEGLIALLHFFAYFLVVGAVLNAEKLWNWFFHTTIGASALVGIFGLFQLGGFLTINQGGVRVDATLGNATYLAIYMLIHAFLTAILMARWRGTAWVYGVYGAVIALQVFILYHTATRGAILGFLGGSLLTALLIALFGKQHRTLRKTSVGILVGIAVLIGGFFAVKDSEFVKESGTLSRLATISLEEESDARFVIWNMAWQGVKERPILGWGQENFNYVFNKYYDPRLYSQEPWFDRVHDIVLDWLIAAGFLGLISYVAIPVFFLWYLWRISDLSVVEKSLFTGLAAGYGFHNLFVFDNLISYVFFFTLLAYVHSRSGSAFPERVQRIFSFDSGTASRVVAPTAVVVMVFVFYFANVPGIKAARALINGLGAQEGGLETNLSYLKEAVSYRSVGRQEAVEQTVSVATRVRTLDVPDDTKTKFFELAKRELTELLEDRPSDARLFLFAGTFYNGYGFPAEAEKHLLRAHELSPGKQMILFELGSSYLNQREYDKAFETLEKAYELEPSFTEAEYIYLVGAVYAGRGDVANAVLDEMFARHDRGEGALSIDNRLMNAYATTGNFSGLLGVWNRAIERQPDNKDFRVSRAATYLQLGNREAAIADIEAAIQIDPSFKEQGEFFIQEIRAGRNP